MNNKSKIVIAVMLPIFIISLLIMQGITVNSPESFITIWLLVLIPFFSIVGVIVRALYNRHKTNATTPKRDERNGLPSNRQFFTNLAFFFIGSFAIAALFSSSGPTSLESMIGFIAFCLVGGIGLVVAGIIIWKAK